MAFDHNYLTYKGLHFLQSLMQYNINKYHTLMTHFGMVIATSVFNCHMWVIYAFRDSNFTFSTAQFCALKLIFMADVTMVSLLTCALIRVLKLSILWVILHPTIECLWMMYNTSVLLHLSLQFSCTWPQFSWHDARWCSILCGIWDWEFYKNVLLIRYYAYAWT